MVRARQSAPDQPRAAVRPPADRQPTDEVTEAPLASRRVGGHAFYAAQARQALGIEPESALPRLADIPLPIFQGGISLGASALCLLARPQLVGYVAGIAIDAALILVSCAAILMHARRVAPDGVRPGLEVCVLPAMVLVSNAVALAGAESAALMAVAVIAAGSITAVVPHLEARRRVGHDTLAVRLGLDLSGIVAMLPLVLAGTSSSLPGPVGMALVGAGGAALCFDSLKAEDRESRLAVPGAVFAGITLATVSRLAVRGSTQGAGAVALLLLWYGLRGLLTTWQRRPLALVVLVEYTVFAGLAIWLLVMGNR